MNYNLSTIQTAFISLVGFKNSTDPQDFELDSSLISSDSGLYVNQVHPYITTRNLEAVAPDFQKYVYDAWSIGETYEKDALVTLNSVNYRSKQAANLGKNPETESAFWEVASNYLFSNYIRQIYNDSIAELLARVMTVENILDDKKIYDIEDPSEKITLDASKIYGIKLTLLGSEHLRVILNQIGLFFDSAKSDLKFYLYNQNTKIKEFTASITGGVLNWATVTDVILDNSLSGDFFLFFKAADLGAVKPINASLYWSKECSRFVILEGFSATDGEALNDTDNISIESLNYGINLNISVKCNLTEFITQNKNQFAESLQLVFATNLLKELEANAESNSNRFQRNIDIESIRFQLYNTEDGSETVAKNRIDAFNKLHKGIGDLNKICLPCNGPGIPIYSSY